MYVEAVGSHMRPRHSGASLTRSAAEADVTAIFAPRICLVDSDPVTRTALADYLSDKGFYILAPAVMDVSPAFVDVLIVALDASGSEYTD